MTTLFISDLHLEEERPDITRAFFHFLDQHTPRADALYILGDFFEAWIGDDEHTPLQQEVAAALQAVSERGTALYLMHGNRDFLIGNDFCQRVGGQLLEDPSVIDLYGHNVLLMHGDSLCTRDVDYMKFRASMRNKEWQEKFLQRPLAERQMVARQLRQMSMAKNQGKQESIMDVTPEDVVNEMARFGVDTLIHGHTHRPAVHELEVENRPARRYVLGDWDRSLWYIRAESDGVIELIEESFPET
ncbi:UDP-2,3-diacylglucosamine diphosphatase [Marinobacteraceae bacterium S3BR75-40.1]